MEKKTQGLKQESPLLVPSFFRASAYGNSLSKISRLCIKGHQEKILYPGQRLPDFPVKVKPRTERRKFRRHISLYVKAQLSSDVNATGGVEFLSDHKRVLDAKNIPRAEHAFVCGKARVIQKNNFFLCHRPFARKGAFDSLRRSPAARGLR